MTEQPPVDGPGEGFFSARTNLLAYLDREIQAADLAQGRAASETQPEASPDPELERQRHEQEARDETDRWLAARVAEDPDTASVFERVLRAEDAEGQWNALMDWRDSLRPSLESLVPDVDPNRPAPKLPGATTGHLPDGTPITDDMAMRALKALGDRPWAELRGRR